MGSVVGRGSSLRGKVEVRSGSGLFSLFLCFTVLICLWRLSIFTEQLHTKHSNCFLSSDSVINGFEVVGSISVVGGSSRREKTVLETGSGGVAAIYVVGPVFREHLPKHLRRPTLIFSRTLNNFKNIVCFGIGGMPSENFNECMGNQKQQSSCKTDHHNNTQVDLTVLEFATAFVLNVPPHVQHTRDKQSCFLSIPCTWSVLQLQTESTMHR